MDLVKQRDSKKREAPWFEVRLPSVASSVRTIRAVLGAVAGIYGMAGGPIDDVIMALSEACSNAATHGSPRGAADSFRVRFWDERGRLFMEVSDDGPGFVFQGFQCPSLEEEHGRGLYLMHILMDHVEIQTNERGTRVLLEIETPGNEERGWWEE